MTTCCRRAGAICGTISRARLFRHGSELHDFDRPSDATAGAVRPAGEETITYPIERGARRRLVGLAFEGNHYFGDEILRSRVRIQPAAFASPGRFSSAQLTADVASMADLYHANGFRGVKVTSEPVDNYRGKAKTSFVRFHVDEGPQTRVADFKLEGNHALSDAELFARDRFDGRTAVFRFQRGRRSRQRPGALLRRGFPAGALPVHRGRSAATAGRATLACA